MNPSGELLELLRRSRTVREAVMGPEQVETIFIGADYHFLPEDDDEEAEQLDFSVDPDNFLARARLYFGPRGYSYDGVFELLVGSPDRLKRALFQGEGFDPRLAAWWANQESYLPPVRVMDVWDQNAFESSMEVMCSRLGVWPDWGAIGSRLARVMDWEFADRYDVHRQRQPLTPYNPHLVSYGQEWRTDNLDVDPWDLPPPDGLGLVTIEWSERPDDWESLDCRPEDRASLHSAGPQGFLGAATDEQIPVWVKSVREKVAKHLSLLHPATSHPLPQPGQLTLRALTHEGFLTTTFDMEAFDAPDHPLASLVHPLCMLLERIYTHMLPTETSSSA